MTTTEPDTTTTDVDVDAEAPWQSRANCAGIDPDLFFPDRGASTLEAKQVCAGCEVTAECLTYALDHNEKHGIWGGLSGRERRQIIRRRRQAQGPIVLGPQGVER